MMPVVLTSSMIDTDAKETARRNTVCVHVLNTTQVDRDRLSEVSVNAVARNSSTLVDLKIVRVSGFFTGSER